jgi:hypothetical protein
MIREGNTLEVWAIVVQPGATIKRVVLSEDAANAVADSFNSISREHTATAYRFTIELPSVGQLERQSLAVH